MTSELRASENVTERSWFYEEGGQRKGPISEAEIVRLIKTSKISYGTSVWNKDLVDWLNVESTELKAYLAEPSPPPLPATRINNTLVWVLAFAPVIGSFLEYIIAAAIDGESSVDVAMDNAKYWYVTLALNIGITYLDEHRLRKAGHDTHKFKGWIWLVPVYLYQRATNLHQSLAYFIVWIVCFVLAILG